VCLEEAIDDQALKAKFNKKKRTLSVSLPIK